MSCGLYWLTSPVGTGHRDGESLARRAASRGLSQDFTILFYPRPPGRSASTYMRRRSSSAVWRKPGPFTLDRHAVAGRKGASQRKGEVRINTESWVLPKLRTFLHHTPPLLRSLYETVRNLSSKRGVLFLVAGWDPEPKSNRLLYITEYH